MPESNSKSIMWNLGNLNIVWVIWANYTHAIDPQHVRRHIEPIEPQRYILDEVNNDIFIVGLSKLFLFF